MGTVLNAGGEADRLAGNVMEEIDADTRAHQEAEKRLEARKKAAGPRRRIVLFALMFTLVALTALNLIGFGPFGFTSPNLTGADLRLAMSAELDDLVDELGAYREEFGTYPENLASIGIDDPAWNYEFLSPNRCRVTLSENREVVTADLVEAGR